MGGGDLNLKKSWHPSTLKNIERVWKAEQKHEAEQKKIEQLQKELDEERTRQEMRQFAENKGIVKKREERLDWMYQGPQAMVNREDYLLGRPVDKAFELAQSESNALPTDDNNVPDSLFGSSDNVVVDLANKIREDPLYVIRKKEEDNKKQLLNNPVRMKQLQLLLKEQLDKSSKKRKDKKYREKSKKHKKHHKESSRRKRETSTSESDSSEGSHVHHKSSKSSSKHSSDRRSRNEFEEEDGYTRSNTYGRIETRKLLAASEKRYHRKQATPEKIRMRRSRSRSRSPSSQPRRKLMPKDMEKKRQEMLENAKWREEQRNKNVQRYRKEEQQENNLEDHSRSSGALFLKPFLNKAASNSTVESRIKSNIYNIQRGRSDMEINFSRK